MPHTEIDCPVHGCDWSLDATPPQVEAGALASVFGVGAVASVAAFQHNHKIEDELQRHLDGHTTLQWARTVAKLRQERDLAVEGLREVREWESELFGEVNDTTSLRRIVENRLVPLEGAIRP